MFRAAISRLGAHLHRHPSPASPPVRALSIGRGKRSSPTAAPAETEDEGLMRGLFVLSRDPEHPPRLLVVQPRLRPSTLLDSKLAEVVNLASSLEEARDGFDHADKSAAKDGPPHLVVQNPASRGRNHADTYFGPGTVDNVKCYLRALDAEEELDAVFINTLLSGIQQRNLEVAWGKPVLDRVGLIIEIFNAHAETKEAKLQSELAALMYMKTRLVRVRGPGGRLTFGTSGEAEVVSAQGRGSGGRGFMSGAGETELQLQRRRIQDRRISLLTQIEDVRRTRAIQRSSRKRHGGSFGQELVTIAVVGYTNAHVLDSSAPKLDEHRSTVLQVLQQIGVSQDKINNMIEVWNKIDLVDNNALTDGVEDEIFLTEGEEEEDLFSEDDVPSEQSSFDSLDDTVDSDSLSEENSENGNDKMASDKSFDEPIDMKAMNSEPSTTECFREPNGPNAVTTSGCTLTQSVSTCHVKTSAVTWTGLKELLQLIDRKLNEQQTVVQRSYGPFDRKWRPCSMDGEKAAEQKN